MEQRHRVLLGLRRFHRDEGGQGIIFAAASLIVLIAFVAMAANVGAAVGQRTKIQLSADAMAYSGAVLEANSLSTIAWLNSGMAQTYYNLMRYSTDLGATAVAAELERKLTLNPDQTTNVAAWQATPAYQAYADAKSVAEAGVPVAQDFLRDLSRIENAIAIVTPELIWDQMFSVGQANGSERLALFPYQRLFPHEGGDSSYRIEKLTDGWRITNLDSQDGSWVSVRLIGDEWHIKYDSGDTSTYEWVIKQDGSNSWVIELYDSTGALSKTIRVTQTDAGWIVDTDNGQLTIDTVTRGGQTGTAITYNGVTEIIRRDSGNLYEWQDNGTGGQWVDLTQDSVTVGDYTLSVHSTNAIAVGPMTVYVGDPPHVAVGGASMTLDNPPWIQVSAGQISVGIHGFGADDYSISVGGHSLTNGDADGLWHMYFNNDNKLWWRQRLTEQVPINSDATQQWQYDYQTLGALMRYEDNASRFGIRHAILDRYADQGEYPPSDVLSSEQLWTWKPELQWTRWFDPTRGQVRDIQYRQHFGSAAPTNPGDLWLPDSSPSEDECRDNTFFLTRTCAFCNGSGWATDASGNQTRCPVCEAKDYNGDGLSDVRVFLGEVVKSASNPPDETYSDDASGQTVQIPYDRIEVKPFKNTGDTRWPLVLTEDFFKWGVNAGAWRNVEKQPVMFNKEPPWGYVAISCARVGVSDAPSETEAAQVRYRFADADQRESWVQDDLENFYRADLTAKLVSSRKQVADYDFDETVLEGTSINASTDTGTSFLWRCIITGHYGSLDEASLWFDSRNGQSSFDMSQQVGNMQDRAGSSFDYNSADLENVIRH